MTKKFTIFTLAMVLLFTALVPVFAASNAADKHQENQKILAKVLDLSPSQVANYEKQNLGPKELFPAAIIAKKSNLSLQQVLDMHQKGKSYRQIAEEKKISSADFKKEMISLRKEIIDEKIKAGLISKEEGQHRIKKLEEN